MIHTVHAFQYDRAPKSHLSQYQHSVNWTNRYLTMRWNFTLYALSYAELNAKGYIGGSVLTRLLSHPLRDALHLTVLVRSKTKASQLCAMGIRAILGSNADLGLLKELASDADLVIACVSWEILRHLEISLYDTHNLSPMSANCRRMLMIKMLRKPS